MEQKGGNTKRKRAYNHLQKESDVLQLENFEKVKNEVTIVSDDKVRNNINKFGSTKDDEDTFIKLVVCPSEADYFESNSDLVNDMKTDFGLQDVSISTGGFDRFITLYGTKTAIAKSATYCSFILAKINNFTKNQLTLKSSYRFTVLVNDGIYYKGLRSLEISQYQYNRDLSAAHLYGDFNNIYNFIVQCTGIKHNDSRIQQQELFGIHLASNILDRSQEKNQLLSSKNRALEFVAKYTRV